MLVALGLGGYYGSGKVSMTALIPTWLGIPVILCGLLAEMKENLRMHVMHAAVLLGLIGFGGGVPGLLKIFQGEMTAGPIASPRVLPTNKYNPVAKPRTSFGVAICSAAAAGANGNFQQKVIAIITPMATP